jgi:hypothetical protein
MRSRMATAIVAMLIFAGQAAASNEELVAKLKTLGKAVDDISVNISNAPTDEMAATLANVTRQTLDNGLKQDRPTIVIKATVGHCRVTIETPGWKLWSEAQAGKVTSHGAVIH